MNKLEISNAMAYLDTLAGQFKGLSVAYIIVNGKETVQCDPKAFGEIAEKLTLISQTVRTEMLGEPEKVVDIECPDPNRPGAFIKIGEVAKE